MATSCSVEVVVLQGLAALAEGGVLPLVWPQERHLRVRRPAGGGGQAGRLVSGLSCVQCAVCAVCGVQCVQCVLCIVRLLCTAQSIVRY